MDDSGKGHHLQTIVTFYAWLHREYGYNVPDLTEAGLVDKGETALPIYSHEIRATLAQCRNRTEADLIIVLAQTGIRLGELCSIRPEFLHDHWMEVWGKPTKVNKSGYRQVPVPNEAYRRLQVHWEYNGELVWQDHYGINHPLAGPVEKADPESRRAINLEEPRNLASPPRTFRVQPAPGAEGLVKYFLHQRVMEAGVYEPGKAAQSFRRAYTDEALKNAEGTDGAKMMIDRILGHFSKKDMSSLYHHTTIDRMVAWAERYAPRSFLGEAGEQGKLSLAKEG
jgi:integrase